MTSPVLCVSETGHDNGLLIDVECQLSNGLPGITIVGFASKAVDEAKERIRGAYTNSNIQLPRKKITLNLAPADIPKDSSAFDLAMAIAILKAGEIIETLPMNSLFLGELALDGRVRPVRGIIGKISTAKKYGVSQFFIPENNIEQAQLVAGITLIPVHSLSQLYAHLRQDSLIEAVQTNRGILPKLAVSGHKKERSKSFLIDDIIGQAKAKRALTIAASGGHNILLSGPPGTGKSMLAKSLIDLLPPLEHEEILEITQLHSLATNHYEHIITARPFRAPHHTASNVALIGGGARLKPGEISLSHHGILFLDEFPEFRRDSIEALRQPLEDGVITVARAKESAAFPADFILIATANPCPCGNYGSSKVCSCMPHAINKYQQKLSGPIVDRIDLYVTVDEVDHAHLLTTVLPGANESGKHLRNSVSNARLQQKNRYQSLVLNSQLSNQLIKHHVRLSKDAKELLDTAAQKLNISARSYMRVIKVARTIADLDSSSDVLPNHISEALGYRKQETTL